MITAGGSQEARVMNGFVKEQVEISSARAGKSCAIIQQPYMCEQYLSTVGKGKKRPSQAAIEERIDG